MTAAGMIGRQSNEENERLFGGEQPRTNLRRHSAPPVLATALSLPVRYNTQFSHVKSQHPAITAYYIKPFFRSSNPVHTLQFRTLLTIRQAWSFYNRHVPLQNLQTNLPFRDKALHLAACLCGSTYAPSSSAQGG